MTLEITPELVDRVKAYLDDPDDREEVWRGLAFMEDCGFDLSLRNIELHAYFGSPESPLPELRFIEAEDERAVLLAMRDRLRIELGKPSLTEKERRSWQYAPEEPFRWPAERRGLWLHKFDRNERANFLHMVELQSPDLVRAVRAFAEYNKRQPDHTSCFALGWMWFPFAKAAVKIKPELTGLDTHHLFVAIRDDLHNR